MKYSKHLLASYLSVDDTPENIADILIKKTCEIEETIIRTIPVGVVIGKVLEVSKHPDADKLNVCTVDCGSAQYQIICGATNVTPGQLVPIATPGTYLPATDMTIEVRKMRGVESQGMICAKAELGIAEDLDEKRIRELTKDLDVTESDIGTPLVDKYHRLNGRTLDVENKTITHRPDLTGHWGLAMEFQSIYKLTNPQAIKFSKIGEYLHTFAHTPLTTLLAETSKNKKEVLVKSTGVNSYIALDIQNISVKKSEFFTRLKLIDQDLQPKNNRVDFSNLFMVTTGQPIHIFDTDTISGNLMVRDANDGETFTDLFGKTHTLTAADMIIADSKKILALAGIIGSDNSGVSDSTKNITIEIANFDAVRVRKTGVRLGLRTDAELRFEKNISPVFSSFSLLFLLDMLKREATDLGTVTIEKIGHFLSPETEQLLLSDKVIAGNSENAERMIFGEENGLLTHDFSAILEGLGFVSTKDGRKVPFRRSPDDINGAHDLYEEVVRIYGFERIQSKTLSEPLTYAALKPIVALRRTIEETLSGACQYTQLETYPWVEEKILDLFGTDKSKLLSLSNAIAPEYQYLRNHLFYNLLSYTAKNSKFFDSLRLFDIGKIWSGTDERTYATWIDYKKNPTDRSDDTLIDAKQTLSVISQKLKIEWYSIAPSIFPPFHPNKQGEIRLGDTRIGRIGSVHPSLFSSLKIDDTAQVTCVTLDLTTLSELPKKKAEKPSYTTLQDQILSRDLAFVMDEKTPIGAITTPIKGLELVTDVRVFDIYQGDRLGAGKKSVGVTLEITGDGSLTTDTINDVLKQATALAASAWAVLRDK